MDCRTILWVCDCGPKGEIEGMFDDEGTLLGVWSSDDANWRIEYFRGFMEKLGIEVINRSASKALVNKLRKQF